MHSFLPTSCGCSNNHVSWRNITKGTNANSCYNSTNIPIHANCKRPICPSSRIFQRLYCFISAIARGTFRSSLWPSRRFHLAICACSFRPTRYDVVENITTPTETVFWSTQMNCWYVRVSDITRKQFLTNTTLFIISYSCTYLVPSMLKLGWAGV